jgi:hypothetical protein
VGLRSYHDFTLGLALLLFAAAVVHCTLHDALVFVDHGWVI